MPIRARISSLVLTLCAIVAIAGCSPDGDTEVITAVLHSAESYHLDLVSGDEEGARIVAQAQHFAISEIRRDESTLWAARYVYVPAVGFAGSDRVDIEVLRSSDGVTAPAPRRLISIRFTVYE